ncbi:predicted protein, partial [Nematostella vectensis]
LGMLSREIRDDQVSASSSYDYRHGPRFGRLHETPAVGSFGCWSAARNEVDQYLQIDLLVKTLITAVATQGRPGASWGQWVTSYSLRYSQDGLNWTDYPNGGIFPANTDTTSVVSHSLVEPIDARFLRFMAKSWRNHVSMRVEMYGCR